MLPDFANYDNVWVEITGADEDHGGTGWEFGTCLWSPTTEEGGGKRYETMWRPQPGDLVLHFYKYPWNNSATYTQLCGYSVVSEPCRIVHTPPPVPEKWLAPAYYRIGLESYAALPKRLNPQSLNVQPEYLARIRAELIPNRPPRYPFATYGPLVRLTQGQYLTQCTPVLYDVLRDALGFNGAPSVAVKTKKPRTEEYKEGSESFGKPTSLPAIQRWRRKPSAYVGTCVRCAGLIFSASTASMERNSPSATTRTRCRKDQRKCGRKR